MPEFVMYEGRQISTRSDLGRELMKHEKPSNWTPEANQYPKALYKAFRNDKGKIACMASEQIEVGINADADARALQRVKQFNNACFKEVPSFEEHMKAKEQGWRDHPDDAIAYCEEQEKAISTSAAERAGADRWMGEQARAEAQAADDATEFHVPEVPEKRKPGRPKKTESVSSVISSPAA